MRLLYTLRYGAASGNCGGDLRLFFTTQNSSDWQSAPAPGMWIHPQNAPDILTLPSGDSLTFALYPITNAPEELYLYGQIGVETAAGAGFPEGPIGQSVGLFQPGQPRVAIMSGRDKNSANGISWDIGFDLAVPWDGTCADCTGQWWAIWQSTTPAPSAPTNLQGTTR